MERLSGLDASFLYLETPAQLMHVCGLIVIDPSTIPGGYSYTAFRDDLERRIRDVPEFTRKLRRVPMGIDHPIWVRDQHFAIERHVHRLALPTPGGYAELVELTGHLAGLPLDRSRPLWEMWVIEGYGDRVVAFLKMHHATVDGVSGANLISHLCSLEPDAEPLAADEPPRSDREPGRPELFGRGLLGYVTRPLNAVRLVTPSAQMITRTVGRARAGTAMAAPFSAPRTSFNGTITGHRTLGIVDLALDEVREIKNATGTTVNDVILTVAGGALRTYLDQRGELPSHSLTATVPVSVRDHSQRTTGANKVSALFAKLGTDVADPLLRLREMAEGNRNAKEHHAAISADALQDWAEFAAPRTFGLAMRTYAGLRLPERHPVVHNLVISNVPGPPVPLYFMGGRIDGLYPLGPVFHGAGLNITVISNNGRLNVGVIACRESVPDAESLVSLFPSELAALTEAVTAEQAPVRRTRTKASPARRRAAAAPGSPAAGR